MTPETEMSITTVVLLPPHQLPVPYRLPMAAGLCQKTDTGTAPSMDWPVKTPGLSFIILTETMVPEVQDGTGLTLKAEC